jgi:4,5-dihydroxyphthalate decarboxylase
MSALQKYKSVTRTQAANAALKDGRVQPRGFECDWVEVDPLIAAFRRMVRGYEFDICELAITTYMCAKAHKKEFTAIPVFIVRAFHHGAILVNKNAGINSPKDLEGKRVGVNRGYTVTTGVWARGVLQDEYGVDLSKVNWVLSGDEHVAEYKAPSNVVPIEAGKKMEDMLVSGELVAAIGVSVNHPDIVPLIPDADEAGFASLARTGHYPINHLVVIRNELLEANPGLATEVFNAFAQAKQLYVEQLKAGNIELKGDALMHKRVMDTTGGDPMPYGIEPNRAVIENLISHAKKQGILGGSERIEDLFAKETLGLIG